MCSAPVEVTLGQLGEVGRGRDYLKTVLVVAGVDDPDELGHEGVELDAVVAAIGADEGHGRRGT